jgi:uncharacterized protein (TIGR02246 family)
MRNRWSPGLVLLAAFAVVGALTVSLLMHAPHKATAAQEGRGEKKGDEEGIRKAGAAYIEAMNKGDHDAVIALWAPDADYIDEAGKRTHGREAISGLFKKSIGAMKGVRVTGKVHSIKFLRPEVALEDGMLEYASTDGGKESNRYAVVWVKSGDRWLISSARDLPAEVEDLPSLAYAQLRPLEWLVGEWEEEGGKADVKMTARWAPNKSFLLMDYEVKREGADPMMVTQRLGWDPLNGLVRSWVFDSTGGFGEAYWQRDGKKWVAGASGVLPDGGAGGQTNVLEYVDDNTFIWRSVDRDVDDQPLPDVEVKMVRKGRK